LFIHGSIAVSSPFIPCLFAVHLLFVCHSLPFIQHF
jgi:hypothetical protein